MVPISQRFIMQYIFTIYLLPLFFRLSEIHEGVDDTSLKEGGNRKSIKHMVLCFYTQHTNIEAKSSNLQLQEDQCYQLLRSRVLYKSRPMARVAWAVDRDP